MYRSGSTWQYDVAATLVERYLRGDRLGFVRGEDFESFQAGDCCQVLKAHDAHPAFARSLSNQRAKGIYAHRDLRDVAFSLMHKFSSSFVDVVERHGLLHTCIENDRFWRRQPGILTQRYVDILADPAKSVREIAVHLGVGVGAAEVAAIVAENTLAANCERTAELARRLQAQGLDLKQPENTLQFDPNTLLHWNHIRGSTAADWRQRATPVERGMLANVTAEWLCERGYEKDRGWVYEIFQELRYQIERDYAELLAARAELGELRAVKRHFEDLGSGAIALAHLAKRLALLHPRLAAAFKRLVGLG
jgi:Sulfotransferase domain